MGIVSIFLGDFCRYLSVYAHVILRSTDTVGVVAVGGVGGVLGWVGA